MIAIDRPFSNFPDRSRSLVIVGAGFCGTVLATHLLRSRPSTPLHITLIERGPEFCRGIAYATRDYPYLLNVPASRMSADRRDPLQFVRFAKRRDPTVCGDDYLPREVYGEYLQALLSNAEQAAAPNVTLSRICADARKIIQSHSPRLGIELNNGATLFADDVVLATGNPPPHALPGASKLQAHPGFVASPWDLPADASHWQSVLIIGTGLSMADVVSRLTENGPRSLSIHALSRHGLVPRPQTRFKTTSLCGNGDWLFDETLTTRKLVRAVRQLIKLTGDLGGDWREVVTFTRTLAPKLWGHLCDSERRRFVRHVQAYWDVHRHRLPPTVDEGLADARNTGTLHVHAGRLLSLSGAGEKIVATWRCRGGDSTKTITVDAVINASGPDYRLQHAHDPLLRSLHAAGVLSDNEASAGIRTAEHCAVLGTNGQANSNLFYLGPQLRATHWEATAAPELSGYAERLAKHLVEKPIRRADQNQRRSG